MIGKVLENGKAKSFSARCNYVLWGQDRASPERCDWAVTRNLHEVDPERAHLVMAATAAQNKRVKVPTAHLVFSWHEDDPADAATMLAAVEQCLDEIGYGDHQALIACHNDGGAPHVHAVVNRVHPETLKAAQDGRNGQKLREACMVQEVRFGLTETRWDQKSSYTPKRLTKRLAEARDDVAREGVQRARFMDEDGFERLELVRDPDARPVPAPVIDLARYRAETLAERQITAKSGHTRMAKHVCLQLKDDLAEMFQGAKSWDQLERMLGRKSLKISAAGRGIRLVKGGYYAKLSDVLPAKLNTKQLQERCGKFSAWWAEKQRQQIEAEQLVQERKLKQKRGPSFGPSL